jgi:5'(3')-deoxyribonucleotidase
MQKKLFLDFDEVVGNTTSAIADYYNSNFTHKKEFISAVGTKMLSWGFEDQCPLMEKEDKMKMWGDKSFFDKLEPMQGAEEYIGLLSEHFPIYIVTIGILSNIEQKTLWFDTHPEIAKYISSYIFIADKTLKTDKSVINMAGGIFLDDNTKNLESSNAPYRYAFGRKTGWNNDAEKLGFKRMWNWEDAHNKIMLKFCEERSNV